MDSPDLLLGADRGAVGGVRGQHRRPGRRSSRALVGEGEVAAANTLKLHRRPASPRSPGRSAAGLILRLGTTFAVAYAVDARRSSRSRCGRPCGCRALPPEHGARPRRTGAAGATCATGCGYLAASPVLLLSFAIDIAAMVLAMPRALFPAGRRPSGSAAASLGWLYAAIAHRLGAGRADLRLDRPGPPAGRGAGGRRGRLGAGRGRGRAGPLSCGWWCCCWPSAARPTWSARSTGRRILQTYAPDGLRGRLQGVFIAVVAGGPAPGRPAGRRDRPTLARRDRLPGSAAGSPPRGGRRCSRWRSRRCFGTRPSH